MIPGNNRLVIILGMAHSGTTLLAYLLRQHPEIFLYTDGPEARLLENDLLPGGNGVEIEKILSGTDKLVLLKRPWMEQHMASWMQLEMPDAAYLYCYRPMLQLTQSWSKPHSDIAPWLREATEYRQEQYYNQFLHAGFDFLSGVQKGSIVKLETLQRVPQEYLGMICRRLGLHLFQFDVSVVWSGIQGKHIKEIVKEELK